MLGCAFHPSPDTVALDRQAFFFFHKRGECLFMFPNTEKLWGFRAKETILQMFNLFPCYTAKNAACPWFLIKEIERLSLSVLLISLPSLLVGWAPRGMSLLCSTASSTHVNLYPILRVFFILKKPMLLTRSCSCFIWAGRVAWRLDLIWKNTQTNSGVRGIRPFLRKLSRS